MEYSIPWIEKYRPENFEDIIMNKDIETQLKIFLLDRPNIHLIITGLPGIGKTSTVRCIAKKILGENLNEGFLELNAAEDRGIKTISKIIPKFCKNISNIKKSKIILLDEADNMTSKCQYDINDMIKIYGKKTKFIFTCNDSTKIIEDIQSVCRIIRFKTLTETQIKEYLKKICQNENIFYDENGLDMICYISNGDMRKSINDLQKTAYTYNKITKNYVLEICRVPDPEDIKKILNLCIKQNIIEADKELSDIIIQGYYYLDIINGFIYVIYKIEIPEDNRIELINIINKTKILISTGLRSRLQLSGMLCRIINFYSKKK